MEVLQHRPRRLLEGLPRAQGILLVRGPRKHGCPEALGENVPGIRQVLGYLLLDGAPLLSPVRLRVQNALHADGLEMEGDVQIRGGDREEVLRHRLLRVGVGVAAHRRYHRRELRPREPRAAAEHHVFLGMCHAGEPARGLVRADQVVDFGRHHGGEGVPDDHHLQAVLQGRPQHVRGDCRPGGGGKQREDHRRKQEPGREARFHHPLLIIGSISATSGQRSLSSSYVGSPAGKGWLGDVH